MNIFPELFLQRFQDILPKERYQEAQEALAAKSALTIRINTLKISKQGLEGVLKQKKIIFREVPWLSGEALILDSITPEELRETELMKTGLIYQQGLSSMLPVAILNPHDEDRVLDMCAAPGSKTTQMAARMENRGTIMAIEAVRGRYYRLKAVIQLMGVKNVVIKLMDARRFSQRDQLFDKILVDAPCSSEGRFKAYDPKTFAYWSLRKIKEMAHKQRGLLLTASRCLRPGGTLVYSTCAFSPEENEAVVDWLLRKTAGTLETASVDWPDVPTYPAVRSWQGKVYNEQVCNCLRVLPTTETEGFFAVKLIKQES
jgi:16S rRNA (cytosine1407-C5)-methyltransferase